MTWQINLLNHIIKFNTLTMEEKIVKDGTKIILFALGTEDTNVTGVITGQLWMIKELDGTWTIL